MATLNELFETYINDNYEGTMSQAAIVKAYELLLGLTGNFADKAARVQYWVDKDLAVSEFLDEFLAAAARLSEANAAAWGETTTERTAVVNAAQNAVSTSLSLEEVGTVVANARASYDPQSFNLTTGVDQGTDFTGGVADDTFTARNVDVSGADSNALSALDDLNGGAGNDTLAIIDTTADGLDTGDASGLTLTGIESVTVRSANATTVDLSSQTDVTSVAITTAGGALDLDGASTQALSVSGALDTITIDGGSSVTVTDAAASKAITIGGTTVTTGAISVTDTNHGTTATAIDGGSTVALTTSGVTTGTVAIGGATAATGAVTVSATAADRADNADLTMGAIAVTGGTTVDVTVSAGSTDASEFVSGTTITQSNVTVTGDDSTTSVTINQDAAVSEATYTAAVAGVAQTKTVEFVAMTSGSTMTVDSLVFTAAKALTAEEVAAAFANMSASETQVSGGPTSNGVFTGATSANWTTGAADGATVTFTEVTPTTADTTLTAVYSAGTNPTVTPVTTGVTAVSLVEGVLGVAGGAAVVVDQDGADATITTIALDGYGASSDIQGADALTTLSLSNSAQGIDVDAAVETLTVNLDNITGGADIDLDDDGGAANATLTTVNLVLASDSAADIIADSATTLNVSGTGTLTTSVGQTDLALLETVTISGAAGLVLTGTDATVLANIDASGTSANVTATIDSGVAAADTVAYAGGTGSDTVTLTADTAVDGDISLGDGDDKLVLTASSTAITGTVTGGAGTDTISMDTASAENLDDTSDLTNLSGFERLELTGAAGGDDIDAVTMGFSYVTLDGGVADDAGGADEDFDLSLANNGTLRFTDGSAIGLVADDDTLTVAITDAATVDATLNVVVETEDTTTIDTVVADDVETINVTATDLNADGNDDGAVTLVVSADAVTAITLDGSADLDLTVTATTATTVDASAMTGALTYTADDGTVTVTGGAGADTLIGSGSSDVLVGGAGNDALTGATLTQLTGGEGNDTFNIGVADNVNSASAILDLSSGDVIELIDNDGDMAVFAQAALVLDTDGNPDLQNYADAAIASISADNNAAWFQYNGNTYIVMEDDNSTNADTFVNGEDVIVKITGLVDLSTASFNGDDGTLEIA